MAATATTTRAPRRPRRAVVDDTETSSARLVVGEDGETALEIPDESEGSRIIETPPRIPAPTMSERVQDAGDKIRSVTARARGFGLAKNKGGPKKPRVSVEKLIGTAWSIAARMVQPVSWPVANVLHVQAPVAGMVLEDVVRNTVVDTVLQPIARVGKGGEVALALLGPPVLVGLLHSKPEAAPVAVPLLKESLRAWLDIAGPKMTEYAEREKKFQEEYGNTIDQMIEMFFTPPEGMVTPDESESP